MSLEELYHNDQEMIAAWKRHKLAGIKRMNRELRKRLEKLIKKKPLRTAKDHYLAAHIYQHGFTVSSLKKALLHAQRSVELGNKKGKWLVAAATDRFLQLESSRNSGHSQ